MQLLHSSYCWQMKAMRVVPTKTYQHLYAKHHAYTMYPAQTMHPLILHITHHADQSHQPMTLHAHLPDQCNAIYPSVVTTISTPPQYAWTLPIVPGIQHQTPLMTRYHQVRMSISQRCLWTMNIGQQSCLWKGHSAYMRIDYPTMCAHTHALMDIMVPPHMSIVWT